jgi:hypothetical protein
MDTVELLLPCGFNTLKYSRVKDTIGICMLADYFMAKKCQRHVNMWASDKSPQA